MSYPGGKAGDGTFQTIINQIPPHRTLVVPFLGNGGIIKNIRPAMAAVVIESNRDVLQRFPLRWPGLQRIHGCGIHWLEMNRLDPDAVIYADPPYLLETRTKKRIYGAYDWSDDDHRRFLHVMLGQSSNGVRCLISGYDSAFYHAVLKGWRCRRFWSATRGGPRLECLWMNFPTPTELHDHRYLGDDKRERERIGRKRKRTVAKLMALPEVERRAILAEVADLEVGSS